MSWSHTEQRALVDEGEANPNPGPDPNPNPNPHPHPNPSPTLSLALALALTLTLTLTRSELRLAAFNLLNVVLHIYGARAAAGAGVAADTLDAVRSILQPHVLQAATVCAPRLLPSLLQAATVRGAGCNRMGFRLHVAGDRYLVITRRPGGRSSRPGASRRRRRHRAARPRAARLRPGRRVGGLGARGGIGATVAG